MGGIEIRLAEPGDASTIAALLLDSFLEYEDLYSAQGFSATTPTIQKVLDRLQEGPLWVALSEGEVVGTASAIRQGESLYVRGMAVRPQARGKRVGEALLGQIYTWAIERNLERLFLSTTPFLDRAIRLYERFGFRRTDEGPHDLFGTPLFTMERQIVAKQKEKKGPA